MLGAADWIDRDRPRKRPDAPCLSGHRRAAALCHGELVRRVSAPLPGGSSRVSSCIDCPLWGKHLMLGASLRTSCCKCAVTEEGVLRAVRGPLRRWPGGTVSDGSCSGLAAGQPWGSRAGCSLAQQGGEWDAYSGHLRGGVGGCGRRPEPQEAGESVGEHRAPRGQADVACTEPTLEPRSLALTAPQHRSRTQSGPPPHDQQVLDPQVQRTCRRPAGPGLRAHGTGRLLQALPALREAVAHCL